MTGLGSLNGLECLPAVGRLLRHGVGRVVSSTSDPAPSDSVSAPLSDGELTELESIELESIGSPTTTNHSSYELTSFVTVSSV